MSDVQAKKKKQMLSSYSIVFLVLIVVAILTWFVPQSVVIKKVLCQMLGCPTTKSPFRNSARHLPSSFFANSHRESGS